MLIPQTRRNPMLMPFIFFAIGTGILGWYAMNWYELPQYSEADIEASVEINLAADLSHMGPHLRPQGERLDQLRAQIRAEVMADLNKERMEAERGMGVGLLCIVLSIGHAILVRGLQLPTGSGSQAP